MLTTKTIKLFTHVSQSMARGTQMARGRVCVIMGRHCVLGRVLLPRPSTQVVYISVFLVSSCVWCYVWLMI